MIYLIVKIHQLGALPHKRFDHLIFRDPFQPGLFCDSLLRFLYQARCVSLLFTANYRDRGWPGRVDVFRKTERPQPHLEGADFGMLWLVWPLEGGEPCTLQLSVIFVICFIFSPQIVNVRFAGS